MAMGFFRHPLAIVCILAAGPAMLTPAGPMLIQTEQLEERVRPTTRRKHRQALASTPARYRRGKRAPTKPRRHANRLHISKRVRRKHRRAA